MVLDPVSQTDPAELILARLTPHVVAAAVLLNCLTALGTLFSIGQNPISVFRFSILFDFPLVLQVADGWLMSFVATL